MPSSQVVGKFNNFLLGKEADTDHFIRIRNVNQTRALGIKTLTVTTMPVIFVSCTRRGQYLCHHAATYMISLISARQHYHRGKRQMDYGVKSLTRKVWNPRVPAYHHQKRKERHASEP